MTEPVSPRFVGTAVAALVALLAGAALAVLFTSVMAVSHALGLGLLALGTAGTTPVLLAFRTRPVARWFCAGIAAALVLAWLAALVVGLR